MIPEKRDPATIDHAVHLAALTGQPVELRDDERDELLNRWAPSIELMQAAFDRMRDTIRQVCDLLTDVELPAAPEPECLTLAELRLHDLARREAGGGPWKLNPERGTRTDVAETVSGWLK